MSDAKSLSAEELIELLRKAPERPLTADEIKILRELAALCTREEDQVALSDMLDDWKFKQQKKRILRENWPILTFVVTPILSFTGWAVVWIVQHLSMGGSAK